jgi:hypothetical protein
VQKKKDKIDETFRDEDFDKQLEALDSEISENNENVNINKNINAKNNTENANNNNENNIINENNNENNNVGVEDQPKKKRKAKKGTGCLSCITKIPACNFYPSCQTFK